MCNIYIREEPWDLLVSGLVEGSWLALGSIVNSKQVEEQIRENV
jgi:hypothetical protein